jgi:hypothetical protein
MLRQLIVDVKRFFENAESRTPSQYALALALIVVTSLITTVLIEMSRKKTG